MRFFSKYFLRKITKTFSSLTLPNETNHDDSMWKTSSEENDKEVESSCDSSVPPILKNENGENIIRMYWFDAYEDPIKHPGTS